MLACFIGNFTRKLNVFIINDDVNSQKIEPLSINLDLSAQEICEMVGYEFERVEVIGITSKLKEIAQIYRDKGVKVLCQLS